jgi:MFS family permease
VVGAAPLSISAGSGAPGLQKAGNRGIGGAAGHRRRGTVPQPPTGPPIDALEARQPVAPVALGVIVSVASVGGVVGALVTERVTDRFGIGRTMAGALLVAAVGMLLFPLAGGPTALAVAVLIAAQALIRTTDQLFYINYLSVCQALTPDRLQGRVNASIRVFTAGTIPLGALVGGLLGETIGLRAVGVVAAAGVFLAFLWVALSSVRSLRVLPTEALDTSPVSPPSVAPEPDAPPLESPDSRQPAAERT